MAADLDDELVQKIAAAVAGKLLDIKRDGAAGPTWSELWPHYRSAEKDKLASWDTIESRWKHVERIIGRERVTESTLDTVRRYREHRKHESTPRKTLTTPTTRNREIELITRMARWASRQKPPLISVNPFAGLEREDLFEPVENVRRNVIEDDPDAPLSLAKLLADSDEFERALVLIAHSSGMRTRELAMLERAWINRVHRIVTVPPGVSKGRRGKRKGRRTFLSEDALIAIDEYIATLPEPHRSRSPYVFTNPHGARYSPGHLTVRFRELRQRCNFVGPSGPVWLHDTGRRSFITLARRRGENTSNIMAASGHSTTKAFERYDIHDMIDAIVVRERIDRARAKELSELAERRRGPQRAPSDQSSSSESHPEKKSPPRSTGNA